MGAPQIKPRGNGGCRCLSGGTSGGPGGWRPGNGRSAVAGKRSRQRVFGSITTCLPGAGDSVLSPAGTARSQGVIGMSTQPAPVADAADRRASLFTPGPRLGWEFRDRRQLAAPFPQPRPDLEAMREAAAQQAQSADKAYRKIRKFLGIPSTLLFVVLLLANGCAANINGSGPPGAGDLIALVICGPGMTLTFLRWRRARRAAATVSQVDDDHERALAAWQQREEAWQRAELTRLEQGDEWGSAVLPPGTLRTDVFGGSLRGWQALLTTHGTSLLASQPVLTVDLTGEGICQELTDTARAAGVPSSVWLLPTQLGASGVLAGLSAAQFADALSEAVHAGGAAGAARPLWGGGTPGLGQLHGAP